MRSHFANCDQTINIITLHLLQQSASSDVSSHAPSHTSHTTSHTGQPEIATVTLNKRGGGMGLSIVAAKVLFYY